MVATYKYDILGTSVYYYQRSDQFNPVKTCLNIISYKSCLNKVSFDVYIEKSE